MGSSKRFDQGKNLRIQNRGGVATRAAQRPLGCAKLGRGLIAFCAAEATLTVLVTAAIKQKLGLMSTAKVKVGTRKRLCLNASHDGVGLRAPSERSASGPGSVVRAAQRK